MNTKVEFSYPGHLGTKMDRLIDSEPVERNYLLLHFLRSAGIGRGRGANFDAIEYSM